MGMGALMRLSVPGLQSRPLMWSGGVILNPQGPVVKLPIPTPHPAAAVRYHAANHGGANHLTLGYLAGYRALATSGFPVNRLGNQPWQPLATLVTAVVTGLGNRWRLRTLTRHVVKGSASREHRGTAYPHQSPVRPDVEVLFPTPWPMSREPEPAQP